MGRSENGYKHKQNHKKRGKPTNINGNEEIDPAIINSKLINTTKHYTDYLTNKHKRN